MHNFEEYKATAIQLKEILDKVSTVEDIINLRRVGISEKDINSIDIGSGFDEEIVGRLHELDGNTKVKGIHINNYASDNEAVINDIIYCDVFSDGKESTMSFDIYGDEGEFIFSDVSIDSIDEYLKEQVENVQDDEPTVFYKVKITNLPESGLSEVTEHLSMNGYTFDTNGEDSIFIYEDELGYLKTILEDRNLKYEVQ